LLPASLNAKFLAGVFRLGLKDLNVVHARGSRPAAKSFVQARELLAASRGQHLNCAIQIVPNPTADPQLLRLISDEVTEANTLDSAMDDVTTSYYIG
jgi:hypothetical protein